MTVNDDPGRVVSDWLHEYGAHRVPNHLDAVLRTTSTRRQRPAWSSLERWLPMQTTLRFAPSPRLGWLMLIVLALVAAIGIAIVATGSRTRPAPPFGLAANGPIVYSKDGDIYRFDPATKASTPLVTGPGDDGGAYYSRDGQHVLLVRGLPDGTVSGLVADADGGHVHEIVTGVTSWDWHDWSPDGTMIAINSLGADGSSITIANSDGSGAHVVPLPLDPISPSWIPGDTPALMFEAQSADMAGSWYALYSVSPDGSNLKRISPRLSEAHGYQYPTVSPDGRSILYHSFDQAAWGPPGQAPTYLGGLLRLHILDIASGMDRVLPVPADPLDPKLPVDQWNGVFSPDGKMIVLQRDRSDDGFEVAIAPADGSAPSRLIGPTVPAVRGDDVHAFTAFSPDGKWVIASYPGDQVTRVLPLGGGDAYTAPFDPDDLPDMQRRAP